MGDALTQFATILAKNMVSWIESGGSATVYLFAILGCFCIIASVVKESTKALASLFIVAIAGPWLLIEYLWKKHR